MSAAHALARIAASCALVLALTLSPALATSYRFLELDELWERADVAVFGTVRSVETEERNGQPWTVVTVEVERRLDEPQAEDVDEEEADREDEDEDLDEAEGEIVELALLGGTLPNGRTVTVALMPSFREDDRVLLLAYEDDGLASPIVGFRQGLWRLTADGLLDEAGRRLSFADGTLRRDGDQGELSELLDAVERAVREAQ